MVLSGSSKGIKLVYPDGRVVDIEDLPLPGEKGEEAKADEDEIGETKQERTASPNNLEADPDARS
jgi:hypothetical protein